METLGVLYGGASCVAKHVQTQPPRTLVGVVSMGGVESTLLRRVADDLEALPERTFLTQLVASRDAHGVGAHGASAGGPVSASRLVGSSRDSAGGRSDGSGGGGSALAAATSPVNANSFSTAATPSNAGGSIASPTNAAAVGVLRTGWILKHRTEHYGCFVVVEDLTQIPSHERVVVESLVSNRVDHLRNALRGTTRRIVLALVTTQPPKENPCYAGYSGWDDLASCMRKHCNLGDGKSCVVLHLPPTGDAPPSTAPSADDWHRSLLNLQLCIVDAALKYHGAEAQRLKKKLKSDKVAKYPVPRMLTARLRFKVAWHFEAARDPKLSIHNYRKGYEELRKLPATLETILVADILFFRLSQLGAGAQGAVVAANDIQNHLAWMESFDPDTVTVDGNDGFVTTPMGTRHLARLLHAIHMAESHRRFGLLMLRVQPFQPADPRAAATNSNSSSGAVKRHFNGVLLDTGLLAGPNPGALQFLYGTSLAYRRVRTALKALDRCLRLGADDIERAADGSAALLPPAFIGRETLATGPEAYAKVRALAACLPWRKASELAYEAAVVAMQIAQLVDMNGCCAHLYAIMTEHHELVGNAHEAQATLAASRQLLQRCPALRDRDFDWSRAVHGDSRASAASVVPYVRFTVAFAECMFTAPPIGADGSNAPRPAPVRLNATFEATADVPRRHRAPLQLRFTKVVCHVSRAVELPPSSSASGSGSNTNLTASSLAVRPAPSHNFEFASVCITPGRPTVISLAPPLAAVATAGLLVVDRLTFTCAGGETVEVAVPGAQSALARLSAATTNELGFHRLLMADAGPAGNAPRVSRALFTADGGLPVCRVLAPRPCLEASIRQPAHAIEGERHLIEITLSVPPHVASDVSATLRIESPDADLVEPVVGIEAEGWGPWTTKPANPRAAACSVPLLARGAPVVVAVVLLCRRAGQYTLPLSCVYSVAGADVSAPMALAGALAVHVLHPVHAVFCVHACLATRGDAAGSAVGDGSKSNAIAAVPTDHLASRFIEATEQLQRGAGSGVPQHITLSRLTHAFGGVPSCSVERLPPPPAPLLYATAQTHIADGRGGSSVPKLPWGKPFWLTCRLANNLQCPIAVDSVHIECHEATPVRVLSSGQPTRGHHEGGNSDATVLGVDEEMQWIASLSALPHSSSSSAAAVAYHGPAAAAAKAAAGVRGGPVDVPQLGTLVVKMRRSAWWPSGGGEQQQQQQQHQFRNRELAAALLGAELTYEVGLPRAVVTDPAVHLSLDYPACVAVHQPFTVALVAHNPHPTAPATLHVGLGDAAVGEMLTRVAGGGASGAAAVMVLRADAVAATGKMRSTLVVPPGAKRKIAWRAVATHVGHQSLPALVVAEGATQHINSSHVFCVFAQ